MLSQVPLFATPWTAPRQPSLSITISQNLLKLMFIESVMPSNHLNLLWEFANSEGCWDDLRLEKHPGILGSPPTGKCYRSGWHKVPWTFLGTRPGIWLWTPLTPGTGKGSARVAGCGAGSIPDSLTSEAMQRGRDFSGFVRAGP